MKYMDLIEARAVYASGNNVTDYLRKKLNENVNTSEIIEIAYDLQAGSYTQYVNTNRRKAESYASELANFLKEHIDSQTSILDVGTGELTTLTLILNELKSSMSEVYAFDISWSRIKKGREFLYQNILDANQEIETFVADMKCIPMRTKSVDVVTSSHALEPNGKELSLILDELFRVARKKLVLFEPSYELNSAEGRRRMDRLGYIKNLEGIVANAGGRVTDIDRVENAVNPLNPTACYVIEPPKHILNDEKVRLDLCVPGTDFRLKRRGSFFVSCETGIAFPILDEIPILTTRHGILATALSNGLVFDDR